MSVVVVARIRPLPGHHDTVRAAYATAVEAVHAEDGCELYALHENDEVLMMVERWTSAQALQAHSRGEALQHLRAAVDGLVDGAAEVTVLDAVPAGNATKGVV